eukprot:1299785-Amphidinium_carterae.1
MNRVLIKRNDFHHVWKSGGPATSARFQLLSGCKKYATWCSFRVYLGPKTAKSTYGAAPSLST